MATEGPQAGNGASQAEQAAPMLMSSFFPSPPAYFAHFTAANLELARKLVAHPSYSLERVKAGEKNADKQDETMESAGTDGHMSWQEMQTMVLQELKISNDEIERVKTIDLAALVTPPDVEVIETDGYWNAFGQTWPIHEKLPTLDEMGVKQLYQTPTTWEDRRKALHALLRTVLHTYLRLLSILLQGPPSLVAEQAAFQQAAATGSNVQITTQADSAIEHLRVASINIHHICNEWRPIQARETLKLLMRNQIDERKARTAEVRSACSEISERLAQLKTVRKDHATATDDTLVGDMSTMEVARETPEPAQNPSARTSMKERARAHMLKQLDDLDAL